MKHPNAKVNFLCSFSCFDGALMLLFSKSVDKVDLTPMLIFCVTFLVVMLFLFSESFDNVDLMPMLIFCAAFLVAKGQCCGVIVFKVIG